MKESPSIKLITLNIERSKHLDLVLPFLEREQPDVVCLQELCSEDVERFSTVLGAQSYTEPLTIHTVDGGECFFSIAIFSRLPVVGHEVKYYYRASETLSIFELGDRRTINRALLRCDIVKDEVTFRIGTTHFTWTPDGEADDVQREDIENLFTVLETEGDIVFTGDFNAPRGKEIFSRLAERYRDNVPPEYTTSIDGSMHRAGALPHMVDGIFSTPGYEVSDVRMVCGVSDHCALVAKVRKTDEN